MRRLDGAQLDDSDCERYAALLMRAGRALIDVGQYPLADELVRLAAALEAMAVVSPAPRVFVTLPTWSRRYGIADTTARRMARDGKLPDARLDAGRWLVPDDTRPPASSRRHASVRARSRTSARSTRST